MKQTVVEWLVDNLHYLHSTKWDDIVEKAKEMEKEQSDEIYQEGYQNGHEAAMNYTDSNKCKCGRHQGSGWKCLRTDCNQNV